MARGSPWRLMRVAGIIELVGRFILAAVFSLSVVIGIDILDTAWELSGVVAEVIHPTITKTPASENWH